MQSPTIPQRLNTNKKLAPRQIAESSSWIHAGWNTDGKGSGEQRDTAPTFHWHTISFCQINGKTMWYHFPKIPPFISNLLWNLALLSQTRPSAEIHKSPPPDSITLILLPCTKVSDYSQAWTHLTQVQDPIWLLVFLPTSKKSTDQVPVIIKFKLTTLTAIFLLNCKDHKALDEPKGSWGQSILSQVALAME